MSRKNVEVAHRFLEAFNLGLDEFVACFTEDVVCVTIPEWPEAGTYRGKVAFRGLWASIYAAQEQHAELDEVTVLDEYFMHYEEALEAAGLSE
jgi:hypothetical protein